MNQLITYKIIITYYAGEIFGYYHEKRKDKLPIFCGKGEQVIAIYDLCVCMYQQQKNHSMKPSL